MGDVAMTVPVVKALVKHYPNCLVTLVSKPFFKPLFDDIANVSFFAAEVRTKHRGLLGLYKLYTTLRKKKITHVADFHDVLRSKVLRTLFRLNGSLIARIDKGRKEKKALIRPKNKKLRPLKSSYQRYADVLKNLGFSVSLSSCKEEPKKKIISEKTSALVGLKKNKWVGIAPFAAFKAKIYPIHLMEKVIAKIASKGIRIFLFGGGPHEIEVLQSFEKRHINVVNTAGKLSLKEEIEVIHCLDLMISMDSGNGHLAAVHHIKTITLWGVTHPYAGFAPFQQPDDHSILPDLKKYPKIPCSVYGNKVLPGYENTMESIPPEEIIEKMINVLNS